MKKSTEKGFSVVELLIAVFVILLLAGGAYFIWHKNQDKPTNNKSAVQSTKSTSAPKTTPVALKTYTNDEYGFSFQYPETWKLTVNLSDGGRGHNEGDVVVTSPGGTKVHFGPNLGGKGGDCWDDEANSHTTRTCSTQIVLSLEKLSNGSAKTIYFYHFSLTDSTDRGGKTIYYIGIESDPYAATQLGANLGDLGEPRNIISAGIGDVTVYVEGNDDDKNNSSEFFDTNEVKEATPILKSFKLL